MPYAVVVYRRSRWAAAAYERPRLGCARPCHPTPRSRRDRRPAVADAGRGFLYHQPSGPCFHGVVRYNQALRRPKRWDGLPSGTVGGNRRYRQVDADCNPQWGRVMLIVANERKTCFPSGGAAGYSHRLAVSLSGERQVALSNELKAAGCPCSFRRTYGLVVGARRKASSGLLRNPCRVERVAQTLVFSPVRERRGT